MSRRIYFLRGLPGSGKSTWAKQYQAEHPDVVRVNKDDLRSMLHNGKHSKSREHFVLTVRDFIIDTALSEGHDVICDDTNFHPRHLARLKEIAGKHGAIVEVKDFTHVPLEECIARDLVRPNSVGERVIREMYRQYIEPTSPPIPYDASLPDVVLCDIDGTLALFGKANPYDRDFMQDEINKAVLALLHHYDKDVVLLSGRKEKFREQTEQWLKQHGVPFVQLYMRPDNDARKDVLIKEELYYAHIHGKCNVCMVIDDRLQVCRMWHRLGLPLFRVGDPDADF
jgi:predicted kinase